MTFPFSNHNYQLRFWMAAGGIDPDEDVRLVVLPPPYMVESLASGHVDGFCVGAPWNSVAVDPASAASCISAARSWRAHRRRCWPCASDGRQTILICWRALIRALARASSHIDDAANRAAVAAVLARRLDVSAELVEPHARRQSENCARRNDANE